MWLMALGALGGALLGGISTWRQGKKEKAALEKQKKDAWQQYKYGKEYSDEMFGLQRKEALDQLNTQSRGLDTQMGMAVDDYNTSLLGQAFGMQDARIQTGSAIGESRAAEGASGTRDSATNEMLRAYAAAGLERNAELQNKQNSNYLNQMVTGANMTVDSINKEKDSWMPGGYRAQAKEAQDLYNLNIAKLGQNNFDWNIQQSKPGFLEYFTGAVGGASMGFDMVNNAIDLKDAWNSIGK